MPSGYISSRWHCAVLCHFALSAIVRPTAADNVLNDRTFDRQHNFTDMEAEVSVSGEALTPKQRNKFMRSEELAMSDDAAGDRQSNVLHGYHGDLVHFHEGPARYAGLGSIGEASLHEIAIHAKQSPEELIRLTQPAAVAGIGAQPAQDDQQEQPAAVAQHAAVGQPPQPAQPAAVGQPAQGVQQEQPAAVVAHLSEAAQGVQQLLPKMAVAVGVQSRLDSKVISESVPAADTTSSATAGAPPGNDVGGTFSAKGTKNAAPQTAAADTKSRTTAGAPPGYDVGATFNAKATKDDAPPTAAVDATSSATAGAPNSYSINVPFSAPAGNSGAAPDLNSPDLKAAVANAITKAVVKAAAAPMTAQRSVATGPTPGASSIGDAPNGYAIKAAFSGTLAHNGAPPGPSRAVNSNSPAPLTNNSPPRPIDSKSPITNIRPTQPTQVSGPAIEQPTQVSGPAIKNAIPSTGTGPAVQARPTVEQAGPYIPAAQGMPPRDPAERGYRSPSPAPPYVNQTLTQTSVSETTVTNHTIIDTVITTVTNNQTNVTQSLDIGGNPQRFNQVSGWRGVDGGPGSAPAAPGNTVYNIYGPNGAAAPVTTNAKANANGAAQPLTTNAKANAKATGANAGAAISAPPQAGAPSPGTPGTGSNALPADKVTWAVQSPLQPAEKIGVNQNAQLEPALKQTKETQSPATQDQKFEPAQGSPATEQKSDEEQQQQNGDLPLPGSSPGGSYIPAVVVAPELTISAAETKQPALFHTDSGDLDGDDNMPSMGLSNSVPRPHALPTEDEMDGVQQGRSSRSHGCPSWLLLLGAAMMFATSRV